MTYRELISALLAEAAEHGDRLLDMPAIAGIDEECHVTGIYYGEAEAATEEYAAEPERFILETNWG